MKTPNTWAKALAMVLVLCMLVPMASCGLFGGSLELKAFTVDGSSVKTSYYLGEEVDFSGIKAYVTYTDEDLNAELTFSNLTFSYPADITDTVGQKEVTVSYDDKNLDMVLTASFVVIVAEDPNVVKSEGFKVDASEAKTAYYIGETIDLSGLKLIEIMSNKSEVVIEDKTGLDLGDLSGITATAGNKVINATYNGNPIVCTAVIRVIDPNDGKNNIVNVVPTGSYKTTFEVGSTTDLSGLNLSVSYEEGQTMTVTSFAVEGVDSATAGTKIAKITFVDPVNGTENFMLLAINYIAKEKVMQFQQSDAIAAFKHDNATATQDPTASGFSGHFAVGGKTYVIGDDNEFKMVPTMVSMVDGALVPRAAYYMNVTIEVDLGSGYVALNKTANSETNYTYSLNGEALATVDTFNGLYKFAQPLSKVKITVLPLDTYYTGDAAKTPVVLEATVIDAYNVHDAKQLSVIDNNPVRTDWNALKLEWGVAGINPAGVVIHNDIKLTYKDVPNSFFYDAEHTVQYYNTATGEIRNYSEIAGMKYLKDWTYVYIHTGNADFVIEGNFFQIDAGDFPLVASPSIFEDQEKTYKSNYSNAGLFLFETYDENWYGDWAHGYEPAAENVPDINVNNLALNGNAGRDCWVIQGIDGNQIGADNELVTAGGLILTMSARYAHVTFNNVVNKCFFLSYNPAYHGDIDLNDVKCYDSYQTAIFAWGDAVMNVHNTYMSGTGGPVIMAQSVSKEAGVYYNPIINITGNHIVDTELSGQEAWFKSTDPTGTVVSNITALGAGLNQFLTAMTGKGANWVDSEGMMNLKSLLMPDGSNAAAALADINAQGTVKIGEGGIERWRDGETFWNPIWNFIQAVPSAGGAPFVTVRGSDGTIYTMCYNGSNFVDFSGNVVTDATVLAAFTTANEIILSQGGMSMLFELYH